MQRLFEGAAADALVEVAALHYEGERKWLESRYIHPSGFAAALTQLRGKQDILFGPALRKDKSSKKEAILSSRTCWVDFDSDSLAPSVLPPTFAVKSNGPNNGTHLYWLLTKYVTPGTLEDLNRALVEHIGGGNADHCWNANRLLRLPGSIHSRTGRTVTVARSSTVTYEPGDIAALDQLSQKTSIKIVSGSSRGYRSRSELDWAVITDLVQVGMSDLAIFAVFNNMAVGEKYRESPNPEHYLQHTIDKVRSQTVVLQTSKDGIAEANSAYYMKKGKVIRKLSTFTFEPSLLLRAPDEDILLGDITSLGSPEVWQNVSLSRRAFTGLGKLSQELPRAEWAWVGNDSDVRQLLPYIVGKLQAKGMPTALAVKTVGRHNEYFVFPEQIMSQDTTWLNPEGPIVYVPGHIEPPIIHPAPPMDPDDALEVIQAVIGSNVDSVIWPVLGWWFASPLKPPLKELGYAFPLLNIFGSRGSGKSTLVASIFMRLWGYSNPMTHDSTTTRFVLLSLLGCSNALPIALAEFRTAGHKDYLDRYIRLAYDLGHDPRGNPDKTVEDFELCAPFVIDGEDPLTEPAAKERVIGVRLRQQNIEEGSVCHESFKDYEKLSVDGLVHSYIQFSLGVNLRAVLSDAEEECEKAFPNRLPHRVRRNYTVVIAGLLMLSDWCGVELPDFSDVLSTALANSYDQDIGRAKLHVDDLVEQAINAVASSTYDLPFFYMYNKDTNIFYFHMGSTVTWYMEKVRRQNQQDTLGREALMAQLEEVEYIINSTVIDNRWCYGVDLNIAALSLDIPNNLDLSVMKVRL